MTAAKSAVPSSASRSGNTTGELPIFLVELCAYQTQLSGAVTFRVSNQDAKPFSGSIGLRKPIANAHES